MAVFPAPDTGVARADQLVLRAVVSAYLGRYRGETRVHTESDLGIFLRWCTDQDLDPLAAVQVDIERYLHWLQDVRCYQPSTVSRRLSVVVGFYRVCVIDQILPYSPADYVRRPTVPPESPTLGLGHLQFEALITTARLSANPNDFALIAMLGLLGLRIFEACGASISDPDEEHGHRVLRVRGKGGKVVLVPLPPAVARAIDRAVDGRTVGPILRNMIGARMDRHAATRRLKHLATSAGVRPGRSERSRLCRCADMPRDTAGGASGLLGPGPDAPVDEFHPFLDGSGGYVDQLKAVVPVRLLVETFERDRLREADPAHRCRRDEPEQMNEEDPRLIDPLRGHAVNLPRQDRRYRQAEVAGQRQRADRRPVEDLDRGCRRCGLLQTLPLEERDRVDKPRIAPRLVAAQGLQVDVDVGRRLVDHGVSAAPQRRQDRRLASARRAGDDVSPHRGNSSWAWCRAGALEGPANRVIGMAA